MKHNHLKQSGSVSVIIPAHNSETYIRRAIDSVLAQTHPAAEIIVVDDGSTDGTCDIVKSYGPPIRYLYQANAGPGAARNAGIRAAQSDWIAFLDSDDEWLPEKLQVQLNLLQHNPELVWATSNLIRCLCDENRKGSEMNPSRVGKLLGGKAYIESYFQAYIAGAGGFTGTKIIRRDIFDQVGLFQVGVHQSEDMDLWCRIAFRWPQIGYNTQPLAIYHMGVPDSLMREDVDVGIYSRFIDRNRKLAANYDRLKDFNPFASYLLQLWMRAQLFSGDSQGLRYLLDQHGELVPSGFRRLMRLAATFPRTSKATCICISRIIRFLRLRKRITRKPPGS